MRCIILFSLTPLLAASAGVVTFSAVNPVTYEQVKLDSVRVQRLDDGRDTTLVGVSAFDVDTWTHVRDLAAMPSEFVLTGNYPNSFAGRTTFALAVPRTDLVHIQVFNVLGQSVLEHSQPLSAGQHAFTLDGGGLASGVYFLRAHWGRQQRVIKMLKTGVGSGLAIMYNGLGAWPNMPLVKTGASQFRFTAFAQGYVSVAVERTISGDADVQFAMLPPRPPDDFTSNWRGFNLLGFFTLEWSNDGFYVEDFQMISEFGFNFVRLPIDYRIYTKTGDWNTFIESKLAQIDQAVEWGQKYGIHVSINLHRAPGYCVNPPSTPLPAHQNVSLWTNAAAQKAFADHWRMFAERYKNVPTAEISFNLVNEPGNVSGAAYVKAVLPAIQAIREVSPERIIITDAVDYGNGRIDEILAYNVVVSPHFYNPFQITHYKAEWVDGADKLPVPSWPPVMVSNYFYGFSKSPWNTPLIIKGPFPAGTQVTLHVLQVSARADFRVSIGKETIFRKDFVPGPGVGEWKEVIFRPEWNVYQNIYDRDYSFTLEKDAAELSFRVFEGDWMTWNELRFEPPAGSQMDEIIIQPGIADWGVPQATFQLEADGSLLLVSAPKGFEDKYRLNGFLQQWVDLKKTGVPVHVGEWGVYNKTPHGVTLAFMENRLLAMKSAGLGWALWNFRGSFGILDSGRKDVKYESYRGHQLDRRMLELLQRY